jgi:hypothetical protein
MDGWMDGWMNEWVEKEMPLEWCKVFQEHVNLHIIWGAVTYWITFLWAKQWQSTHEHNYGHSHSTSITKNYVLVRPCACPSMETLLDSAQTPTNRVNYPCPVMCPKALLRQNAHHTVVPNSRYAPVLTKVVWVPVETCCLGWGVTWRVLPELIWSILQQKRT